MLVNEKLNTANQQEIEKIQALTNKLVKAKTLISTLKSKLRSVTKELSDIKDHLRQKDDFIKELDVRIDDLYTR